MPFSQIEKFYLTCSMDSCAAGSWYSRQQCMFVSSLSLRNSRNRDHRVLLLLTPISLISPILLMKPNTPSQYWIVAITTSSITDSMDPSYVEACPKEANLYGPIPSPGKVNINANRLLHNTSSNDCFTRQNL